MMGAELAVRSSEASVEAGLELAKLQRSRPWMLRIEEHPSWDVMSQMKVTLRASIALPRLRVRDLLGLQAGQVLISRSSTAEDIPLKVGAVQLGWSEFEVLEQRIALRLTRLG